MTVQRFARDSRPVMPWKNGGGTTREIASWPPGAGLDNFDWRVSIATIAASGPFSQFPGVDRTIMLLDGDGVLLQGDGLHHRLDHRHQPFAFRGEAALACSLLGGASSDFNVMSRRSVCKADVVVVEHALTLGVAHDGLLMSLAGGWRTGNETLARGEGFWWADSPTCWALEPLTPDARLVAVRWTLSPKS
jgi:uncharacterized protein